MKIKIELPSYEEFEKVFIKLDKPRVVEYKDGRKSNPNVTTHTPLKLINYKEKKGVYIILKDGKVGYVGATTNLFSRIGTHKYLIKNQEIKYIYFLELKEKVKRYFYEIFYKYYYFGKVSPEYFH